MTNLLVAATIPDSITFAVAAVICLVGAAGVVLARNPVHSALMLVMTLFGVAVLFLEEDAQFLAAVQVIVYAGAIVVLFLFVIMLLGVDRKEVFGKEPLPGQRVTALCLGVLGLAEVLLLARDKWPTGAPSVSNALGGPADNVQQVGQSIFTTYLLAFEVTAALLVVAVVGAVVLARRPRRGPGDDGSPAEPAPAPAGAVTGADPESLEPDDDQVLDDEVIDDGVLDAEGASWVPLEPAEGGPSESEVTAP
jgi:NADH-quinone oxidoreductase subunit J